MSAEHSQFAAALEGLIVEDMAWCWWTQPRAVRIGDVAYFGALDSKGRMQAATFNLETRAVDRAILAGFEDDDHNNPALVVDPARPLLAFYSRHDAEEGLRYRRSLRPLDISEWEAEQRLPFDGSTSYAEVHARGDTLHLFSRVNEIRWGYRRSDDWAVTWTEPRDFLSFDTDQQVYMATALLADGRTMRMAVSGHPKEYYEKPLHDVWACLVDLETGAISNASDGKVIANLFSGAGLPLNYTDLEKVESTPPDRTVNLFDVSDGPTFEIGFVSKIKDDHSNRDATYHVTALRDGKWATESVVAAGATFGYIDAGFYVGGVAFPHRSPGDQIYLTREAGGVWSLELWSRSEAGEWSGKALLGPGSTRLTRPWSVVGGGRDLPVVALALEHYDDTYFGSLSHLIAAPSDELPGAST